MVLNGLLVADLIHSNSEIIVAHQHRACHFRYIPGDTSVKSVKRLHWVIKDKRLVTFTTH